MMKEKSIVASHLGPSWKVDLMNLHTVETVEKNLAVTISQVPSPLVMISLRDWSVQ